MAEKNPLADKRVRTLFGVGGAVIVAFVAIFFVDGMVRWLMLGIAALDAVVTPYILGLAVEQDSEKDETEFA